MLHTRFALHTRLWSPASLISKMASTKAASLSVFKEKCVVDGKFVGATSNKCFDVLNPSSQEQIGSIPDMDADDTKLAIDSAHNAFQKWRFTTAKERSAILKKCHQLMISKVDELATLITLENGKTYADAKGEVLYSANYMEWFSEEGRRVHGEIIPSPVSDKKLLVIHQPIGVCGFITPWNFPLAMLTRKVGAALAAGCSVVAKPAEDTPYSGVALAYLALEAGLPPGVFNVVTASRRNTNQIGETLCKSEKIAAISFTGSTPVGKILMKQSSDTVKRVAMELGGNAPFIVFQSANIDQAVKSLIGSKFRCSGQTCVCPNRIFVHENVHDEFVGKLVNEVEKLTVGDGFDSNVTIGPLINESAADKVERILNDSLKSGAKLVTGGKRSNKTFFQPTVLTNVTNEMACCREEIFGPLAPIIKFQSEEEVISSANQCRQGLAGYFFSQDIPQIWRIAEAIEVGIVGVNESLVSNVEAPFGGVKESGIGREGSSHGIHEYLNMKYVCMNHQP